MTDDARVSAAKVEQDYDADPPRCHTCVYFRREPHTLFKVVTRKSRKGRLITSRVPFRKHPLSNPIVDRCSFGNFLTRPNAICSEWRTKEGDRLESEAAPT